MPLKQTKSFNARELMHVSRCLQCSCWSATCSLISDVEVSKSAESVFRCSTISSTT